MIKQQTTMQLLAGDIGGTKTILTLVEVNQDKQTYQTIHQEKYPSSNYPDLVPIIKEFLASIDNPPVKIASLAIAGPVINNTCKLTNLSWDLDGKRIASQLEMDEVILLNDFAAVSYGILYLEKKDLHILQSAKAQKNAPIAVIGAGTGLGEGFLIPQNSGYEVFPTEGGHTEFPAREDLEWELYQDICSRLSIDRVSVERVISGQGIVSIYQFLRDKKFAPESVEIGKKIRQWEASEGKDIDPGAIISQAAQEQKDTLCQKTMSMFISSYGAEAGNQALKLLSYGGVYIAGGIAAKNLSLMENGEFIQAFNKKGRMSSIMQNIPVYIILNQEVGLIGSIFYGIK